jgi:hypothetical protein
MLLLLIWLHVMASGDSGVTWLEISRSTPFYSKPDTESRVLLTLQSGDRVAVREKTGEFQRVQFRQNDKWRTGYVLGLDLMKMKAVQPRDWGGGLVMMRTTLEHEGRAFSTEDQVNYTTDAYASTASSYGVAAQVHDVHFWRFFFGRRNTYYKTKAHNDVGSTDRDVELKHKMWSVLVQKMWTPYKRWKFIYLGGGVEGARATDVTLKMNGAQLTTTEEDLPVYFGVQAVAGAQFFLPLNLSVFAEVRPLMYFHDPTIKGLEIAGGLLFWP